MKLQRRALALLIGLAALVPGLAIAAPAPVTPAPVRPGAAPPQTDWWVTVQSYLPADALVIGKQVLLSLLLFLGGWFVAKFISWLVFRGLCKTSLDNKLAEKLRLSVLLEPDPSTPGAPPKPPPPNALERFIASIVFYMLMLLVVVGVLQFAGLSQAAGPIQGLVDTVVQALPLVGKAIVILLVAYFGGTLLGRLLTKAIAFMRLDTRFAELSADEQAAASAAAATTANTVKPFSKTAGDVVFWLVMMAGLAGAFDALRITPIAEPLNNALDRVVGVIPSLGFAALLVLAGYVIGRVVRVVVHNLLDSLGFNRLVDKIGLGKLFGTSKPSAVLGMLVMAFIMFQASVAALNELGLVTLSGPLTEMMARFWVVLPNLAVSVLVIAAGVVVGRIIRNVVAATLRNLGFDRLVARLGVVSTISARPDKLGEPSELAGFLVHVAIVILATAQACENLQLHTWAVYLNAFLGYAIKNVLVAAVVVGVGVAIGNYVRDLIAARAADPLDTRSRWLGEFARYTILVFAVTMALQQLQVAENFVLLAFGLLFGGLCLAFALAFGLGSKDVAGEIVKKSVRQAQAEAAVKPPTPAAPTRPTGSLFNPTSGLEP